MRRIARDWFHIDWPRPRVVPNPFEEETQSEINNPWYTVQRDTRSWPGWHQMEAPTYTDGGGLPWQTQELHRAGQRIPLRHLKVQKRPLPDAMFWSPEDLGLPDALLEASMQELIMQMKLIRRDIGAPIDGAMRLDPAEMIYHLRESNRQLHPQSFDPVTGESLHVVGPGVVKKY
jgi:hypothetical protein